MIWSHMDHANMPAMEAKADTAKKMKEAANMPMMDHANMGHNMHDSVKMDHANMDMGEMGRDEPCIFAEPAHEP
jgi:hypothetical protein